MGLLNSVKEENFTQIQKSFLQSTSEKIIKEQKKQDNEGKTALMHGVISGNLEMVKLLCQEGRIDIMVFNAQDKSGMTAVMHAAKLGRSDILKFFYNIPQKLTNDINEQNFSYVTKNYLSGLNALMLAILSGHADCLKFLYCKEIQYIINQQDNEGKTAIMLALADIAFGNVAGSKEEVENAKSTLDELFWIIEIIFNRRDEKYLNSQFNNKLNLTIQDRNKQNIFAHAREAKCEKELLGFIASIPIDAITPNLSIRKLLNNKQLSENVKCTKGDLTNWIIIDERSTSKLETQPCKNTSNIAKAPAQHLSTSDDKISIVPLQGQKTNKRPITEVDTNDTKPIEVRKRSNNKKIKVTFYKPNSAVTSCDMKLIRLRDGVQKTQFCVKPKKIWMNNDKQNCVNIVPTKGWLSL